MTEPRTEQDDLRWLSELEGPCAPKGSQTPENPGVCDKGEIILGRGERFYHDTCHGTGRVPRFPMLRLRCLAGPHCDGTKGNNHENCSVCHGRGWVMDTGLEKLMDAARAAGWPRIMLTRYDDRTVCRLEKMLGRNWLVGEDLSDAEALASAIRRAEETG